MCRFLSVRFLFTFCFLLVATTNTVFAESAERLLQQLDRADIAQVCEAVARTDAEASTCIFGYCNDNGNIPVTVDPGAEIVCKFKCDDLAAKAACAQRMIDDFFNEGDTLPSCSGWCWSSSNSCTLVGLLGIGGVDIDIINLGKGQCAYQYGIPHGHSGSVQASCSCESLASQ